MRLRRSLQGLGALLVLTGILIGLPVLLVAVGGNPLPDTLPTLDQARDALLRPDDGTLALAGAVILGWLVWAALAVSILIELAWQLRGIRAPRLPGLTLPQASVRGLVTAALALFIAAPLGPNMVAAAAEPAPQLVHAALISTPAQAPAAENATAPDQAEQPVEGTSNYQVQPGDTLWSIAENRLGSGHEYHRILDLNRDQLTAGADWVTPGLELTIPAPADRAAEEKQVIVVEGDTLSGLAATHLGDSARWPQIYRASHDTVQPDGRQLADPDLIYPGWRLTLPGHHPVEAPAAAPVEEYAGIVPPTETNDADQDAALARVDALSSPAAATAVGTELRTTAPEPVSPEVADGDRDHAAAGAFMSADEEVDAAGEDREDAPPWLLEGIVGSGALLGGALFLALGLRRRSRFRTRRPGRGLAATEPALVPVEKTIETQGVAAAPTLEQLDETLRRLGARCRESGVGVPAVVAVQLAEAGLTLHLQDGADLGEPWDGSADQLHWFLPSDADLEQVGPRVQDAPAPFPLLVSIGAGDDGSMWLLNLEDLEVCLTGAPEYVEDLARFLAAEVAVNPWSAGVRVDCLGVAHEVIPMNPARLREATTQDLEDMVAEVVGVIDRTGEADVVTARVAQTGEETWPARLVLLNAESTEVAAAGQLSQLLSGHAGRTGASILVRGGNPSQHAMKVVATADGRVQLPAAGLDLVGVGLTADEAAGCAALLAQSQTEQDVPMPPATNDDDDRGWRSWADQAGAILPEHTTPRASGVQVGPGSTATLLPEDDQTYVEAAATTKDDLATLSPHVDLDVAQQVVDTDPRLDEDLAAWWEPQARVPKLTLLGPVKAKTWGKPMADRKAYFTELLAYLGLRPGGVTAAETAEAFNLSESKARDYVARCRDWLGNDADGQLHVPYAQDAPATQQRGVNVYQVRGLLVDVDLFRRLRARGEARGGGEGMNDLKQALRLVVGKPFDQLRRGGWAWLFEGDRLDQHMTCAVVDVAHLVVTHDLQAGDLAGARAAAEIASLAAPHEEIPTLDLAAVTIREGHPSEATRILRDDVCNRTDDPDGPPADLPERTRRILDEHGWLADRKEAV
ncbi:LysM peptidoglycan-binding domain-containing protein [Ornithinimicrobium sp. F0845]|uniref:LysM peptidoglycan-binding domain-containing protein n=1 Tax=Ornithinimicrobium sp. F0845 TaxID=2926412 RepID=UPI001FF4FB85|nr:LysM peptidoglycan-binding domain-containing protein [Ornithinimicrobium sp. F0845]MCK0113528.1 LysM peptidoglycan-binding domain-containing protein [Ornithinimicrobium sp. F0845]